MQLERGRGTIAADRVHWRNLLSIVCGEGTAEELNKSARCEYCKEQTVLYTL